MLLAGDIGGTKTVLALYRMAKGPRHALETETFPSREFDSLESIVSQFLRGRENAITHAAFGVAGPVVAGRAEITNLPWTIDSTSIRDRFDLIDVHLLNDLEAVANSVPILEEADLFTLNAGEPVTGGAIAVIAPGTGLGEAFLVWDGARYIAFPTEGGHADFAPVNEIQVALLEYLHGRMSHVSYERVCSGIGIPNIYRFLQNTGRHSEPEWLRVALAAAEDATPVIVEAAKSKRAEICVATLDIFVDVLAREAGNMALKVLATGGVYIGGGIPPRILEHLQERNFIEAFVSKGRFRDLLERVPVHVIRNSKAALLGTAHDGLEMIRLMRQQTAA